MTFFSCVLHLVPCVLSLVPLHRIFPVAILIFLATATRTRIITANFGAYTNRFLLNSGWIVIVVFIGGIIFASVLNLFFIGAHTAHVGFLLTAFLDLPITLLF